jgi:protein-tyrosine-phosphatase
MGEAILQTVVGDAFEVVSAGCLPLGYVHEGAIEAMAEKGLDLREAKSQHWTSISIERLRL